MASLSACASTGSLAERSRSFSISRTSRVRIWSRVKPDTKPLR